MSIGEISRRSFLILGGSAVLLTACTPTAVRPGPTTTPSTPATWTAPLDISSLLGRKFHVAHRGSGDNWPEHTLTAYTNSLAAGADAVEVSVCSTSDGVLICHHDLSAGRVLGVDRKIAEMTWGEVQGLSVDARVWLGAETPLEPVARLDEVLATLDDRALVFVEDKQGTNTKAILDLLDAQPRATERFVWKQWAPAAQVKAAKERGYAAWGYFDEAQRHRVAEFASVFDVLGVPVESSDGLISEAVSTGVPVMCWEVRFHDEVERLQALGVVGLMCANIGYLLRSRAEERDSFNTGRRAAGDLPAQIAELGWAAQPAFAPGRSAVRIQRAKDTSYLMGSLATPGAQLHTFRFTMCWPDAVPDSGAAGVAFALTGDGPGGDGAAGEADGYILLYGVDGVMRVEERVAGTAGAVLASAAVGSPQVGDRVAISIELDDQRIRILRDGESEPLVVVDDARWRGPWNRLVKAYATAEAVEFSAVSASLG